MPKKGEKHSLKTIKKISEKRKGQPSPTKGIKKTPLQKENISVGKKGLFKWIEDPKLSKLVSRDFAIANLCFRDKLAKPSIILYAGVLEAILKCWLKKPSRAKFEDLIDEAAEKELIRKSSASKLHTLRDFRNYVHIHKELKENFPLNDGIAQLAQKMCDSVIKELKKNDSITKEKISNDIKENKQIPVNKKLIYYAHLEERIMKRLHKKIGGEIKHKIHFVYGFPEKPEFKYTPDGVIRKGKDIFFIEIKHVIDKKLTQKIIESGIQTLKMVLDKFRPSLAPGGEIKAYLVIASPYDLRSDYTINKNIVVKFIRV